jgi:hypothetical protein
MRTTRHLSHAIVIAAGIAVTAAPARAQEPSEFQPYQLPGWVFTPGVTASTMFDSNVALAAEFETRPDTQGDKLFVLQPFGQLEYNGPRTKFESGYRGYLRRYFDFDQLNGFDQRGYASFRHLATRHLTFFVTDSYAKVPTTDELMLNGVPFTRTGSQSNSLAGGIESRLSRFMDFNVRYDLTWVNFDEKETLLRDGYVQGVKAGLSRRLSDRSSFGGEYGIRFANLNEGLRRLTFQDVGATYRYDTGPRTTLDAAGGVSFLMDRTLNANRVGPYVRGGVTHREEHFTVGANYAREFVPSFGFGGSNESQAVRGFVQMPLARNRMYVQQAVSWRRTNPFITTELPLNTWWLTSTVGYAFSRWFRAEGLYAFTRQDSSVPGGLINRHRVGGQVVIAQPVRIH